MAQQFPLFDIGSPDLEPDSEFLHTPVDMPYVYPYCHLEYPAVQSYRYHETTPAEPYHWQSPPAGCGVYSNLQHSPGVMQHESANDHEQMDLVSFETKEQSLYASYTKSSVCTF